MQAVSSHQSRRNPRNREDGVTPFNKESLPWGDINICLQVLFQDFETFTWGACLLLVMRFLAVTLMTGVFALPVAQLQAVGIELLVPLDAVYDSPELPFCQGKTSFLKKDAFCQGFSIPIFCWVEAFCQGTEAPADDFVKRLPCIGCLARFWPSCQQKVCCQTRLL